MITAATTKEVLTPESPRWDEFADALAGAWHDPRWHRKSDDAPTRLFRRKGNEYQYAKRIMAKMGGIDIPASLEFFKSKGGYCDGEILLNVDPGPD